MVALRDNNKYLKIHKADVATINNCLATISGYSQLLWTQPYVRVRDRKTLEKIFQEVERIAKLLPKTEK